jgi:allophanate hydrolase subunit 2
MADAQTTGGYPIIGVVIGADLPLAAQLLPNDQLSFASTTIDEAVNALQTTHGHLQTPLIENDCLEQLNWAEAPGGQLLE